MRRIKRIIKGIGKKLIGSNSLLYSIISREDGKGNHLKAAALALWMFPVRKLVKVASPVRKLDICISREYYEELHELLHIAKINGSSLVRIGRNNDGGYIMPDDFGHDDKIAYSFGINTDVSWDKWMASRGYDIFMYDHTINGLPEENPRFHWSRLGIADSKNHADDLRTLDELIKANHHEDKHNMILKMDVEKAEWGFFEIVSSETLSRFSQILIEFHGINDPKCQSKILPALRKLNLTHKLVHIHGQNVGYYVSLGEQIFCDQIEVSYVRRDKYSLDEDYDVNLPLNIDMPADPYIPEISLGWWNRKINPDDKFSAITVVV